MNSNKKVISFLSAPGGVGKTTLALVLAMKLSLEGKRVLMIDMDPSYGLSLRVLPLKRYLDRVKLGRTIDNLIKKIHEQDEVEDYHDYIVEHRHKSGSFFNLIISTEKLSEVIDAIWYGSEAGREYLLEEIIDKMGIKNDWDLIILDTIPFYEPKYSILTFMASELCIIPMRPSIIDTVRTINMLNTLKKKLRRIIRDEKELMSKFAIIFNMVFQRRLSEKRIPDYKNKLLEDVSPHLKLMSSVVYNREAFKRFNTPEEQQKDLKDIDEAFKNAYEELKSLIK